MIDWTNKTSLTLAECQELMDAKCGDLWLSCTNITELPNNLVVKGSLYLGLSKIRKLPDGLVVGGDLDLSHTPLTELPDDLVVGGSLYLNNSNITKLPNGLIIGIDLVLNNTKITKLPNDLVVGGDLDLYETTISELPDDLVVGWQVYFNDDISSDTKYNQLTNGTYVPNKFIYADGILTHVRNVKQINGYTVYVGKIKGWNVITDGTYYAHCSSLHDGMADLQFKALKDRGANQYKHLTVDDELSATDMITMYRIITGACQQGTARFIDSLGELKDKYTIREAIELTTGQYGSEQFARFFG